MQKEILVTRSSLPPMEEYIEELKSIWDSHWLTNMGEKHRCFQKMLKQYLKVDNIDLLTNGHMALELSLQALNLHGEVITTPFTFASTTHAIVRNGLTPVFCDINNRDYTIDVEKLERLITNKTSAIVPVHVYGNVCNVEEIERIAQKYGLKVIYDAAHTFGVRYRGNGIGTYGDVSCFSFHATKVFNSIEGGAVCFKDEKLGKTIYQLKNFGIRNQEVIDGIGANAKMNEFCAAMGICNLRHIGEEIEKRRKIVEHYNYRLKEVNGIKLNVEQRNVQSNYAYYPVAFDEKQFGASRNDVFLALKTQKIYARKYFYPLTNTFDCYKGWFDVNETPVALGISRQILTLPLYADLTYEEVDKICDCVMGMYKNKYIS